MFPLEFKITSFERRMKKRGSKRCANLNSFVQPACLPQSNTQFKPGHKCHVIGWGKELGRKGE